MNRHPRHLIRLTKARSTIKEKKKLSRDKTAIIILILFIVSALGIDHFNKIDPVEMLYIKYSTIEILQNIFLPR